MHKYIKRFYKIFLLLFLVTLHSLLFLNRSVSADTLNGDAKTRVNNVYILKWLERCVLAGAQTDDWEVDNREPKLATSIDSKPVGPSLNNPDGEWGCGTTDHNKRVFSALGVDDFDGYRDKFYKKEGDRYVIKATESLLVAIDARIKEIDAKDYDYYPALLLVLGQCTNGVGPLASDADIPSDESFSIDNYIDLASGRDKGKQYFRINNVSSEKTVGYTTPGDEGDDGRMHCDAIFDQVKNLGPKWKVYKSSTEGQADNSSNSGTANDPIEPTCEGSISSTGWAVCPLVNGALEGVGVLENNIKEQLRVDLDSIAGGNQSDTKAIRSGNGSITVFANTAFAIGVLWIVVSQAITGGGGGGFFGAYEAKKVLPKLIAGVVVANFSWDLTNVILKLSNSLGDATKSIMLAPFSQASGFGSINIGGSDGLLITGAGLSAIALGIFGFFAVSPILIAALVSIVVGYFALIFRKALIIGLVTFAPIALVISPFAPNITKKWFNLLRNMIFMYPVIMGLISVFTIMSYILNLSADAASGIGKSLLKLASLASLFAPYFMIVMLFKLMGDVLGKLAGAAQAVGDKAGKNFGQRRLEGNRRRMARDDKKQERLGLRKLEARRQRYGKITRQQERKEAGGIFSKDRYAQGLKQIKEGALRDKVVRGRLNPTDKKARDQYRNQLSVKNWEEEHQLAADDLATRTASLSHPDAVKVAQEQAMKGTTEHERRAGRDMLVKRRAGNALREVQEHDYQEGRTLEVNSFVGANYAELQSIDQGLTKVPGLTPEQQHLKAVNTYDPVTNGVTGQEDMSTVPVLQARINQSAVALVQSKPEDLRAHIDAVHEVRKKADQLDEALLQGQFAAGSDEYIKAQEMADGLRKSHSAALATIKQVQDALADPSSSLAGAAKTDAAAEIKTW